MATFSVPTETTIVRVSGTKSFFCGADLDIPQVDRESIPMAELSRACGDFLLAFHLPPVIGMTFDHEGHLWRVDHIHESVKRFKSKGTRSVPVLTCTYLGRLDNLHSPTVDSVE
jgi:hypothetical protein